jgi:hypothetical protein
VPRLRSLALLIVIGACAPLPALTFVSGTDDAGTPPPPNDATILANDAAGGEDAGEDSLSVDTEDSGDAGATIECGSAMVTSCVECPGSPLRCKKGTRDQCVADCTACAANWFPCVHCATPDAAPYGSCIAVRPDGEIACTIGNLCGCNTAADCPQISGAAETCDLVGGHMRCLTCGSPSTSDASCASAGGGGGVCQIADGAAPKCE